MARVAPPRTRACAGALAATLLCVAAPASHLSLSAAAQAVPAPPTPSDADPNDTRDSLGIDLAAILTDSRLARAQWAAQVQSLVVGDTLFSREADRLMIPGSNQKIVSAAVAAERLGWDFRFTTRVLATGPIDPDGTLHGDLLVVGDGDPSINPRDPARWRIFDDWARELAGRGLRVVDGHLVGDDDAFEEPGWGDGWSWNDLAFGFGSQYGALQFHENQADLTVGPGAQPGRPVIVTMAPLGSGLRVDQRAVTGAVRGEDTLKIFRSPGSPFLEITGQLPRTARPQTYPMAVFNPTSFYLTGLREALGRHGIVIGGREMDIDEMPRPPDRAITTELLVDHSPPLADLIDVTLKWSRNEYAETLLLASAPSRPASPRDALTALGETLRGWGVTDDEHVSRDGSGLSRYNYVTARALTRILQHVWEGPGREAFRSALPSAGESGTMANRLARSRAAGRVWAKTGTLTNVRALSGYLLTSDDEPLVFSVIVNHFTAPPAEIDGLLDRVLLRLTQFSRRP